MRKWEEEGKGKDVPRLSDLLHLWLRDRIGIGHTIDIVVGAKPKGAWSVRVDGILICWVDDNKATIELASGEAWRKGEVRRRRDVLKAIDPLLFDKLWERMELINVDVIVSCDKSITEYTDLKENE